MRGVREKARVVLAWLSYALAIVGGAAIMSTFVGGLVAGFFGMLPWTWLPLVPIVVGIGLTIRDLARDAEPNMVSLLVALILPSVSLAAPGRLSEAVRNVGQTMLGYLQSHMAEWLGTASMLGIAAACAAGALVLANGMVAKGKWV